MSIDKAGREECKRICEDFRAGRISGNEFLYRSLEANVSADDAFFGAFRGTMELSVEEFLDDDPINMSNAALVSLLDRLILFLSREDEFKWKSFSFRHIVWTLVTLGFGKGDSSYKEGEKEVWPFFSRSEYDNALMERQGRPASQISDGGGT